MIRIAPRRPWHAVTFGLILLNGFSPYLGLKTEAAFSMYRNLRTEGPHWNHLLLPAWLKLGPYQDDLVSIHASTEDVLRQHHERGSSSWAWSSNGSSGGFAGNQALRWPLSTRGTATGTW